MKKLLLALAVLAGGFVLLGFWLADASQMLRIRALMAAVSIGVFLITLLAIRGYKLREKYAVLWLATAAMITLAAFFPQVMDAAREWFGMQYVSCSSRSIFRSRCRR